MGYTAEKVASMPTKHPSKRSRSLSELSTSQVQEFSSVISIKEDKSSVDSDVAEESSPLKKKYQATKSALILVLKLSLSTRKAATVLQSLAYEGLDVPTQLQSGTWRRVIKDANKVKTPQNKLISEEDNKEYQEICIKNYARTLNTESIFIPL